MSLLFTQSVRWEMFASRFFRFLVYIFIRFALNCLSNQITFDIFACTKLEIWRSSKTNRVNSAGTWRKIYVLIINFKPFYLLFYRIMTMQTYQFVFLVLFALVMRVASTAPSGSEFVAAVYEHAFVRVENRTVVRSQKQAVAIVMQNMDVYEAQMKKAKEQVL